MHFWELSFTLFFRCSRCWSSADFLSFYSKIFLSSLCLEYIEFLLRIRCIFLQMNHQNIWLSTVYIIDLSGHIYNIRMCTAHSLPYRGGVWLQSRESLSGDLSQGGFCPGGFFCPGVSVQGALCPGGSLSRGESVFRGSLPGGSLSGGLCPVGSLCPEERLCSDGLCLGGLCPGRSLSRGGHCPGKSLCPGGLCPRVGFCLGVLCLGGLCLGVSVQG